MCSDLIRARHHLDSLEDRTLDRAQVARQLDAVLAGPDPDAAIFAALSATVSAARYWQDPDETDQILANPESTGLFRAVAEEVGRHPATQWWSTTVDLGTQVITMPDWTTHPLPFDEPAPERLRDLRLETVDEDERMHEHRQAGGEGAWAITSGTWWTPPIQATRGTTRTLERFGPVDLSLEEDAPNLDHARSWPITSPADARVFEIDTAATWADLVTQYPIDVTFARGANWLQATRRDESWVIPDWEAVSADYDAVHLTVAGYLSASGRVIEVGHDTATFIAGWSPDQTYWLQDVTIDEDNPSRWVRHPNGLWEPA